MARKKKKKIRVDLDLPKSDKTRQTFLTITITGAILGISCLLFWASNAGLIFGVLTPAPANGNPVFINTACGFDPNGGMPDYSQNESCYFTKERAATQSMIIEWDNIKAPGLGQQFDVTGIDEMQLGTLSHPPQELRMNCDAVADENFPYTITLWEPSMGGGVGTSYSTSAVTNQPGCELIIDNAQPAEGWEVWLQFERGLPRISEFTLTVEVDTYDGIPDWMNDQNQFIGPEVNLGALSLRPLIFVNFFGYGFILIAFPGALYWDKKMQAINAVEEKFPDFLRDLAEYWKGGLSMTLAVRTLARSEYGALNDEVQKMAKQLSWGVAFGDVIVLFAERVGTPLVKRAISLIGEANKAGGKISDILVTAANDSREIKFLEGERERAIASYIAVIWTSYFVFLGVIVVLAKVFIPAIASSNSGEDSAQIGNMVIRSINPLFFLVVFFYGVSAQALGNGAMAGLMATGRLSSGMKHAGMMLIISTLAFNFVAFSPSLLGVQGDMGLNPALGTFVPG
ncbi:MAG: type II secretion system F family protein [Euryarchaeota archaeon]|nr:type II secretion system F family protein [Euryarchaeota archaeon]